MCQAGQIFQVLLDENIIITFRLIDDMLTETAAKGHENQPDF